MAKISQISRFEPLESFPQCDFEDDAHPFCDWTQMTWDGGHWTQGSKHTPIQGTGLFGGSLNRGEEIEDPSSHKLLTLLPARGLAAETERRCCRW